jgi:integrase
MTEAEMSNWVKRWKTIIAKTPVKPGVWRKKEGGFVIRARVKEPRTGRMLEIRSQIEAESAEAAYLELQRRIEELRDGVEGPQISIPSFGEYAASLLERKVAKGEIKSASSRQKWAETLEHHLVPRFGRIFIDHLRKQDVEDWLAEHGRAVRAKTLSPNTVNSWLGVLRVIVNTAVAEYELPRNPIALVKELDTTTWHTYTEEQPNSLTPDEVPQFLAKMRELFPQHFAFVALGFATGLRPSSLRPLRRCGASSDVLWEQGVLLVRRSQTCSDEPMETTKTGKLQRISLPEEVIDILRWHVEHFPTAEMRESELLFPNRDGGYRAETHLDRAFAIVTEAAGIKKRISPRAMRRTFQDLARAAEVRDIVTRSVSGHSSEAMQRHYSTVSSREQKEGLARVVSLAKFREAARLDRSQDASGSHGGSRAADAPSAQSA